MRTLMTRSVSIVSTYESPKERERSPDQCASRLFGVLYRWLDRWTRLPANFLTPCALESLRTIIIGSWQPTHWHCMRFKSVRHQKVGWQSYPSIEPSIEHSKKPTSTLIRASFLFFWTLIRGRRAQWTLNTSSVSARDQSLPGSPPPAPFSLHNNFA